MAREMRRDVMKGTKLISSDAVQPVSKDDSAVANDAKKKTRDNGCCCCKIVFLDMLEDLVRDRFITTFVVMFLLTMIVFSGTLLPLEDSVPYVERLSFASPPQYSLTIGIPSGRTPRVQAFMSDSSLPRSCTNPNSPNCPKIQATIAEVVTVNSQNSLDCSSGHLEDVKGTLESERLRDVCSVSVTNGIANADSKGLASFPDFTIHGPEGKYLLNFKVDNALVDFTVEMANPVVAMFLSTGFLDSSNMFFDVGVPLPVQPSILVSSLVSSCLPIHLTQLPTFLSQCCFCFQDLTYYLCPQMSCIPMIIPI